MGRPFLSGRLHFSGDRNRYFCAPVFLSKSPVSITVSFGRIRPNPTISKNRPECDALARCRKIVSSAFDPIADIDPAQQL